MAIDQGKFGFIPAAILGLALLCCPDRVSAQFPFELVVEQGSVTQVVTDGATLSVSSTSLGAPIMLSLIVTNVGGTSATLSSPQLLGDTTDFAVTSSVANPTIGTGQSTTYSIVYTSSTINQVSSLLTIPFNLAAVNGVVVAGFISLGLQGTAPGFVVSYFQPPLSNVVTLSNGGTMQFPQTPVGGTATATLAILNDGTATGMVNAIAISGSAFQTQSLPLLPGVIASGQTLEVAILYKPTGAPNDTGTLTITLAGQTIVINLAGSPSQLQYTVTQGGQTSTVSPNQTIAMADTNVGSSASAAVAVTNAGSAAVTIGTIAISGQGFQLTTAPALPLSLLPGATTTVTFTFTPAQAGTFTGKLGIGGDTFNLTGKGLGTLYTYSYATGSAAIAVVAGGGVFFPPTQVGQSSSATFTLVNAGTIAGTISGISVGAANSPFSLSNLPQFPLTVAPAQSVSFQIAFAPTVTGSITGLLNLDAVSFTLSGSGTAPPALPSYSFTGASGTEASMQQPSIGLNLASPYPIAVTGTLTMNVFPNGFSADPAIQFSTGGRTAPFTIAANTTSAVFASGNSTIRLQTGSTAGTITIVPSFQTSSGISLTPANPVTVQLVVPAAVPTLVEGQVASQTATGLTLAISGVSNTQDLSQLSLTFSPQANFNLSTSTFSVPLSVAASDWFESAAAAAFGGQFTATIPFTFSSGTTSLTDPSSAIATIMVTATNSQGTSAPITITLQ